MKPENLLAIRYIKSRKRNKLMSFLSVISIVGVALGVATLIIVVSVMSGFINNLKEKLLGANSDITITRFDNRPFDNYSLLIKEVEKIDGVAAAAPFTMNQVLLTSQNAVTGVIVRGVEPEFEEKVSKIASFITEGDFEELSQKDDEGMPKIFLGRALSFTLGVFQDDIITVVSPYGAKGPFGMIPKMKRFKVAGYFDMGIYEYNNTMAYISLSAAQDFFSMNNKAMGLNVAAKKGYDLAKVAKDISQEIGYRYWARDWLSMNQSLFAALKLEQFAMFIVLTLIIIVASFSIISMISITVKDKNKDIAILTAFGASRGFIRGVFLRVGFVVGFVGTMLGNFLAITISIILKEFKIIELPKDVYFMDSIPINIDYKVYILVTLCALSVVILASLFPANQASKMRPIDALRND